MLPRTSFNIYQFQGHETSALTTANAILLLSMHPEIQDRVVEELKDVFMDADELPSYEHLCKMPYTEMVLHETMRIFPVGPYITRVTTNEVKLGKDWSPYITLIFVVNMF